MNTAKNLTLRFSVHAQIVLPKSHVKQFDNVMHLRYMPLSPLHNSVATRLLTPSSSCLTPTESSKSFHCRLLVLWAAERNEGSGANRKKGIEIWKEVFLVVKPRNY